MEEITRNAKVTVEDGDAITTYYVNDYHSVHKYLTRLTENENNPLLPQEKAE